MRLLLALFMAASCYGAECTSVETLSKDLVNLTGNRTAIKVRIHFTGDVVNQEKSYFFEGDDAQARIEDKARSECKTLTGFVGVVVGVITPSLDPTPIEQGILDANEARRTLRNLNAYQSESKKDEIDEFGSSGITVAQARGSLETAAEVDISNQTTLSLFLEQTR